MGRLGCRELIRPGPDGREVAAGPAGEREPREVHRCRQRQRARPAGPASARREAGGWGERGRVPLPEGEPRRLPTLLAAPAGATQGCDTVGLGDTGNNAGGFYRTATLEVATGAATATLTCWTAYRSNTVSRGATAPACRLTLRADAGGTTATATSTSSYVLDPVLDSE